MCMLSLGDFLYFFLLFLLGAGGVCGLLINGIFLREGGGGSCLFHSKTGNSFGGGVYSNLNVFGHV